MPSHRFPRTRGQSAVLAGAVLAVVAIVVGVVALAGRPSPQQSSAPSAPSPSQPGPDATTGTPTEAAATPATAASTAGTPTTAPPTTASPSVAPASPSSTGAGRGTSSKKGVSTWDFAGVGAALADCGASWYWNWSAGPTAGAGSSAQFVPMIWGAGSVTDQNLDRAMRSGTTLLGFNEPDFASQANMSVERALELWPRLEATGMRLGSPAPAVGGATPGGWLDRFLSGARERGYRVDFIALHWYGADFSAAAVGHLRGYLQAVWDRYHMPIWLTEFALIRWVDGQAVYPSDSQQAAFITGATAMLESLSFVERYAWFALPAEQPGTGLYRDGSTPTAAGLAYRAAGRSIS